MVAFCHECSQSLPFADLVISDGEEKAAPGYECPHCNQPANPESAGEETSPKEDREDLPDELVIKDGQLEQSQ